MRNGRSWVVAIVQTLWVLLNEYEDMTTWCRVEPHRQGVVREDLRRRGCDVVACLEVFRSEDPLAVDEHVASIARVITASVITIEERDGCAPALHAAEVHLLGDRFRVVPFKALR